PSPPRSSSTLACMRAVLLCLVGLLACGHPAKPVEPVTKAPPPPVDAAAPIVEEVKPPAPVVDEDLDSKDILAREPSRSPVLVKHVLIAWAGLDDAYRGHLDPRAAKRTNADAAKLARDLLAQLKADPKQIDGLVVSTGEDPGAISGQ